MNIVILNDSCEMDGGAALVALDDARSLVRCGHRVIFFSACGTPPDVREDIEWISLGQRTILDEPRRWKAALMGLWNGQAARALKKLLATLPRDSTVVHLHSWSKALSGSVVHAVRQQDYRLVCTLHDYFSICPNGSLYDYPARRVCGLKPMSSRCVARNCDSRAWVYKVWRVLRQWIWIRAGVPSSFSAMIAVSEFEAAKLGSYALGRKFPRVVENLPSRIEMPVVPASQRRGVLYVGRVAAEKGVEVYLEASVKAGVQAEVLGDGPLAPELKRRWPDATFSGWLPQAALLKRNFLQYGTRVSNT